jgi:hypothetical protein
MVARALACAVLACALALAVSGFGETSDEDAATVPGGSQITITGSLLCQRACVPPAWDCSPAGDHTPVLFALHGTPQIETEVDSIMREYCPGQALDCDQAQKMLDAFTARLKYYLAPSRPSGVWR